MRIHPFCTGSCPIYPANNSPTCLGFHHVHLRKLPKTTAPARPRSNAPTHTHPNALTYHYAPHPNMPMHPCLHMPTCQQAMVPMNPLAPTCQCAHLPTCPLAHNTMHQCAHGHTPTMPTPPTLWCAQCAHAKYACLPPADISMHMIYNIDILSLFCNSIHLSINIYVIWAFMRLNKKRDKILRFASTWLIFACNSMWWISKCGGELFAGYIGSILYGMVKCIKESHRTADIFVGANEVGGRVMKQGSQSKLSMYKIMPVSSTE